MKRTNLLRVTLALLATAVGCADGTHTGETVAADSADVVCDSKGCISQSAFAANIAGILQGKVAGYEVLVGGGISVSGGLARTAVDSPPSGLPMSSAIQFDAASLSKIVTTVAVLRTLANRNISIDSPITPYLPASWKPDPSISTITFRMLLEHRSGFRFSANDCCPTGVNCNTLPNNNTNFVNCHGNPTFANLQSLVQAGVTTASQNTACYDNCNFAIFRDMLPAMEGNPYLLSPFESEAQWDATEYMAYVNQLVFQPLGLGTRQCSPSSSTGEMLAYPFPAGVTAGWSGGDETLTCGGGGWSLSANDLMVLATDLASGTKLLTPDQKALMTDTSQAVGWDNTVRNDCPAPYVCKNGLRPNGASVFWSYMGIFQCSLPVVAVVNSFLPPAYQPFNAAGQPIAGVNSDIIDLVAAAFKAAAVPGTPVCCDGTPPCNGVCCGEGLVCNSANQCAACVNAPCSCVPLGQLCDTGTCCGGSVCKNGVCALKTSPTGCNGRSKPTAKCTAGWVCCGDDGWACGVCS